MPKPSCRHNSGKAAASAKDAELAEVPSTGEALETAQDGALGLTTATAAQVVEVTKELFPKGTDGLDQAEVLKAVFLHLKRRNAGG